MPRILPLPAISAAGGRGCNPLHVAFAMTQPPKIHEPEPPADAAPACAEPSSRQAWRSEELLGERTEVLIVHGSEIYRLRRTRQDKLILYK